VAAPVDLSAIEVEKKGKKDLPAGEEGAEVAPAEVKKINNYVTIEAMERKTIVLFDSFIFFSIYPSVKRKPLLIA